MNSKQENLIWRYLDGASDRDEQAEVDRLLQTDEGFRELFLQCQVLHRNLGQMEAEGPSMRFVQNIMDRLPPVSDLATSPLISARWLRLFFGSALSVIAFILGSSLWLPPVPANQDISPTERLIDLTAPLVERLPTNMLLMAGLVSTGLLLLLLLDRWLQGRFMRS